MSRTACGDWNDSPYRAYIERRGLKDIMIVGRVSDEDLPRYYRSAQVFCSPAVDGESFGVVLLEAMASGVPVVASNIEGYRQVVNDEREGLLVPPRDAEALASAVCRLLQDRELAARLGATGLETALDYSWTRIAEQVLDFYARTGTRSIPAMPSSLYAPTGLVT